MAEARRVLVVDDSAAYRRIVSEALAGLPGISVAASVGSLAQARRRIEEGGIDLVTLDVGLGAESGLELLEWLAHERRRVPVILVTGQESAALRTEVDAILLGATSLVRKPRGDRAPSELRRGLERALALPGRPVRVETTASVAPPRARATLAPSELIAVGASTGGPPVVLRFLRELPGWLDLPVLITQHIPAEHVGFFVAMLREQSGRDVRVAGAGDAVERGLVLVAPPHRHLQIVRTATGQLRVGAGEGPEEHFCRPAVDPMFRSIAQAVGGGAIGVVMTGMGADGGLGAVALREQGAPVIVQDEASSVVWGMPGAVVALGAADAVVPAERLAAEVARRVRPERRKP